MPNAISKSFGLDALALAVLNNSFRTSQWVWECHIINTLDCCGLHLMSHKTTRQFSIGALSSFPPMASRRHVPEDPF